MQFEEPIICCSEWWSPGRYTHPFLLSKRSEFSMHHTKQLVIYPHLSEVWAICLQTFRSKMFEDGQSLGLRFSIVRQRHSVKFRLIARSNSDPHSEALISTMLTVARDWVYDPSSVYEFSLIVVQCANAETLGFTSLALVTRAIGSRMWNCARKIGKRTDIDPPS